MNFILKYNSLQYIALLFQYVIIEASIVELVIVYKYLPLVKKQNILFTYMEQYLLM